MRPLVLSSDSHVFEPPDLRQTCIDAAFRDRAPRIERIDGADQIVVEADQILAEGRFEDVRRGGHGPEQHLKDMALDGLAGQVFYPSQGLFYFKVADTPLMSAIFRAYNDWLADFCRTDPARLKGIAMINLADVQDGDRGAGAPPAWAWPARRSPSIHSSIGVTTSLCGVSQNVL